MSDKTEFRVVSVETLKRWQAAFAEELAAYDIDPPIHHVKQSHDEIEQALSAAPAAQPEPVAWCHLTPSGKVGYFDGKPMVMFGSVGNEHHETPLYAGIKEQP